MRDIVIAYVSRRGPPEAMNCPVFMCDQCRTPIQENNGQGLGGIVIWCSNPDGTQEMATVHKGGCDRAYEAANPRELWMWDDLDDFLDQLAHNTAHEFPAEDNVEYVAPAPSRWRQGHYER